MWRFDAAESLLAPRAIDVGAGAVLESSTVGLAVSVSAVPRQSMKPTTLIFIGTPLEGEEARFLRALHADLSGREALILANFEAEGRQIDFVVVTPKYTALLEHKHFPLPIFGQQNGDWEYFNAAGARVRYSGGNPWQQARGAKYALSDAMRKFQRECRDAPGPTDGKGFYAQFAAFVCICPRIDPRSQVTKGDYKVAVASYEEVLGKILSEAKPSSWSLDNWTAFAEKHLSLTGSTLEQATNPDVSDAIDKVRTYRSRVEAVIGAGLPPLLPGPAGAAYGSGIVNALLEPRNFFLVGPSGSAKTFHLHHAALALAASGDELPLLLEAKRYRGGDFWTLLRSGTAPLLRGDPIELLQAIQCCGLRPVLMLDALNECPERHLPDLLLGMQAFALQYDARAVVTSQVRVELSGDIACEAIEMSRPDADHKRSIFAYHAGLSPSADLDVFCSGFSSAYDLTIAGRCHSSKISPGSRTELYDRYVRRCLPEHTAIQSALLRMMAGEMGRALSLVCSRDQFERTAERFLGEQRAPLARLDEIRQCRLVVLEDNLFSFEHESLLDYFRAEDLRRSVEGVDELVVELRKPRNAALLEFVIPRLSEEADVEAVLSVAYEPSLLSRGLAGGCGRRAQSVLARQGEALLDAAAQDLSSIELTCRAVPVDRGQRRFDGFDVVGSRQWTDFDRRLCVLIGQNIGHPRLQGRFLDLMELTEWALRVASSEGARRSRFKPDFVWQQAVHIFGGILTRRTMEVPCSSILSALLRSRMHRSHYEQGLPIRANLMERVRRGMGDHFAMLMLFEDLSQSAGSGDVAADLDLIERGWETGVYILRCGALDLLQAMSGRVHEDWPGELGHIREMLHRFDAGNNILLSTHLVETMASYEGFDPPVSFETALEGMRALVASGAANDPGIIDLAEVTGATPADRLASLAHGSLAKIFEDVFQGVYYEAYGALSVEERRDILLLAANDREPGMFTEWILKELLSYGGGVALPVFERFASQVDAEALCVQETVARFVIGVRGCAQWSETPPRYHGVGSPEDVAWRLVGEILFWVFRSEEAEDCLPQARELWSHLSGPATLAVADVLFRIANSSWLLRVGGPPLDLVALFASELGPILEYCLANRGSLPTIFRRGGGDSRGLVRFVIDGLARIGAAGTLPVLRAMADDQEFGKDAIGAIQAIQRGVVRQAGGL